MFPFWPKWAFLFAHAAWKKVILIDKHKKKRLQINSSSHSKSRIKITPYKISRLSHYFEILVIQRWSSSNLVGPQLLINYIIFRLDCIPYTLLYWDEKNISPLKCIFKKPGLAGIPEPGTPARARSPEFSKSKPGARPGSRNLLPG